ncbi:unnamed protein product, partial [Nesidiocoris tenuis]
MDDELRVVQMGSYKLRFENDDDIGEWFEEKARVELRETPELREESLNKLKDMIAGMYNYSIFFKLYYPPLKSSPHKIFTACNFYSIKYFIPQN